MIQERAIICRCDRCGKNCSNWNDVVFVTSVRWWCADCASNNIWPRW